MLTTDMMRAIHDDRMREIEERIRLRRLLDAGGDMPGRRERPAVRNRQTIRGRGIGLDPA